MEIASTNRIIDSHCKQCFLNGFHRLLAKYKLSSSKELLLRNYFNEISCDNTLISPLLQQQIKQKFVKLSGIEDPYIEEKESSNKLAMELVQQIKQNILQLDENFDTLVRLAIAGNIMDYAAFDSFDLDSTVNKALNIDLAIDHTDMLLKNIKSANLILYLGDNAGEIVFDKLFIDNCLKDKVVYVVRDSPILNDVTYHDAVTTGMTESAKVISSGFDAPSTVLGYCSSEFLDYYLRADLIISKGQGNLEGLIDEKDNRIFFLLMAKCDVIAERLSVNKNSFVVLNSAYVQYK